MKKSIMLSSFIMLIILFVTLSTTTFAWYQATGGEIHISGSSQASVTTTGPDSPYLVISKTNSGWPTSSEYESAISVTSYITIEDESSSTYTTELAYPELSAGVPTGILTSPITNEDVTSSCSPYSSFYLKNTGSLALEALLTVKENTTDLDNYSNNSANNYAYMLKLFDGTTTTYYYSNCLDENHSNVSASRTVIFAPNTVYTATIYIWLNNQDGLNSSNSVNSVAQSFGDIKITFTNITISI